jgi:A/G-specific adenine glycosylase
MTTRRTGRSSECRALLRWYDTHRRDLPWRRTRDPYAIWISETMLQQTRVETVIPYYERFLSRFPDVTSLASADLDDIYSVWAGLGYYSRARNLHAAARSVVADHAGQLPSDTQSLRSLKGIGRYTAGALASIAFDRPEPILDGNVARVLTRLRGIREDIGAKFVSESLWQEAAALADGPRPGALNQALMELGATVCMPRAPRCPECPLRSDCDARRAGDAESLPVKARARPPRPLEAVAAWLPRRGRVLAVKRTQKGLMTGLWELPGGEIAGACDPESGLRAQLAESLGLSVTRAEHVGEIDHLFSHRRLRLHVFRCSAPRGRLQRSDGAEHRWLPPQEIARLPHGAATRKALALLGLSPPPSASARSHDR